MRIDVYHHSAPCGCHKDCCEKVLEALEEIKDLVTREEVPQEVLDGILKVQANADDNFRQEQTDAK